MSGAALLFWAAPGLGDGGSTVGLIQASFQVDANGAASYVVPLDLPPGTAGLAPRLGLAYGSQGGNGILGMGWDLEGLSKIERCSATLVQDGFTCGVNYDDNDRFCLDGERLVNIGTGPSASGECHVDPSGDLYYDSSDANGNIYHTERESWRRVVASSDECTSGPCAFTVTTKGGWTLEYGNPGVSSDSADARVMAYDRLTSETLGVRRWALNKVTDTNGNSFTVTYTQDPLSTEYPCPVTSGSEAEVASEETGDPDPTLEDSYICRIDYTANSDAGLEAQRHVLFGYESRDDDVIAEYQGGGFIQTSARLTSIQVQVAGSGGDLSTARTYELAYDDTTDRATARSRLSTLNLCGADGGCFERPTACGFGSYPDAVDLSLTSTTTGSSCESSSEVAWTDFNGDGRVDWLCADGDQGIAQVQLSTGTDFDDAGSVNAGQPCSGTHAQVDWGDFDGDGKDDWLCYVAQETAGSTWVALSTGTNLSSLSSASATSSCTGDWMWTDFNGDGLTDWLCWEVENADVEVYVLLSDGESLAPPAEADNGVVWDGNIDESCSSAGVDWIDFDGDGLYDLVCNDTGSGEVWVEVSTGESLVSVTSSSSTPLDNSVALCETDSSWADVNGDGLDDWTCADRDGNGALAVLLSTGTDLASADASDASGEIAGSLTCNGSDQTLLWIDFNGDGMADWTCTDSGGNAQVLLSTFESDGSASSLALNVPAGTDGGQVATGLSCEASGLGLGDFNGDSLSDWLCTAIDSDEATLRVYSSDLPYPDLVESLTNGFGGEIAVTYQPLTDPDIYTQGDNSDAAGTQRFVNHLTNGVYPVQDVQNSLYVAAGVEYSGAQGGSSYSYTYSYTYTGAVTGLDGRGWLGFATLTETDDQLESQTRTSYDQTFPFNGQITDRTVSGCGSGVTDLGCPSKETDGSLCSQVILANLHHAYYCQDFETDAGCSSDTTFMPYPGVYQVLSDLVRQDFYDYGTYLFSLGRQYGFDSYGDRILVSDFNYVEQSWDDGNTDDGNITTDDDVYTAMTYYHEAGPGEDDTWLLGFPTETTVCSAVESGACSPATILKQSKTNYDYASSADSDGCAPDDWTFAGTMNVICQQKLLDDPGSSSDEDAECASADSWLATTFEHDAYGNVTATTDPVHQTTTTTFDSTYQTFPATVTTPPDDGGASLVTKKTFSAIFGRQLTETDPNQNEFAWCLDEFGRLTASQGPVPAGAGGDIDAEACPSNSYTKSPGGMVNLGTATWSEDSDGPNYRISHRNDWASSADLRTLTSYRDGLDRTWRRILSGSDSETPIYVDTAYFDPRLRSSRTVPYYEGTETPYSITTCYDSAGRRTRMTKPYQSSPTADVTLSTTTWTWSGDPCGGDDGCTACGSLTAYPAVIVTSTQASGSSDPWQRQTRQEFFNSAGKMAAVTMVNNGAQTCFEHDRLGRPIGLEDPIGATAGTTFNSLDAPLVVDDPDLGTWQLCYDADGRPASVTDAKGQTRTSTFDNLSRPLTNVYKDSGGTTAETHTVTYDSGSGSNLKGRLAGVEVTDAADSGNDSSYVYGYDEYGNRTATTLTFGGSDRTTQQLFDPLRRVTTYTYPDGSTLASSWSSEGFLLTEELSDTSAGSTVTLTYSSYTSLGRAGSIAFGDATDPAATSTLTYYPLGELATRNLTGGGTSLLDETWTWNELDSLTEVDSQVDTTYGYDKSDVNRRRIISVDGSTEYAYDDGGNLTTNSGVVYSYNSGTHQIAEATSGSSFSAGYDANGSMTTRTEADGTAWTLTFDTLNRLAQATAGDSTASFVYDYQGRRLQKTAADGTVTTYVSPLYVVSGSEVVKYIGSQAGRRAALTTGDGSDPSIAYFHSDQRNSVVLATDDTGAETARVTYDPWGNIDSANSSGTDTLRYTFNNKELDSDTGLYDFEARYYDPVVGRFVSADTQLGGARDRQDAFNRYAFVLNDPASYSDPTGHSWFKHAWRDLKHAAEAATKPERKALQAVYRETDKIVHSTAGKIVISGLLDASEIAAGVALDAIGFEVAGGALMGAGESGLTYTLSHANGSFSWKGYGVAEAEGAVAGAITAGVGSMAAEDAGLGTKAALAAVGSGLGNAGSQVTGNLLTGHSAFHDFSWSSVALSAAEGAADQGGESVVGKNAMIGVGVAKAVAAGTYEPAETALSVGGMVFGAFGLVSHFTTGEQPSEPEAIEMDTFSSSGVEE